MRLTKVYEIRSKDKIIALLNSIPSGTLGTIDANGFPQLVPMNFVYAYDAVYMHSFSIGEKIENIKRDNRVGFEAHRYVEFLPSYFFDPRDASQADTLYMSVIIKGYAELVYDMEERARALNALMRKYQREGFYEELKPSMDTVRDANLAIIKVKPVVMTGKYKLGQQWPIEYRRYIAKRILERGTPTAVDTVTLMGFDPITLNYKHEPLDDL
jgi:nitroimidazol reductase NimA-like FMN-containing flavoprotein (pyridoxamine 5'-phosphate oxidase superfamily)